MKHYIARAAITAGLTLGSLGLTGLASAADHSAPGIPGTPNCAGQTIAYLNQAGKDIDVPGLGNIARFSNLSVKEVHDIVDQYCSTPPL